MVRDGFSAAHFVCGRPVARATERHEFNREGNAQAQYNLGICLAQGEGVQKNPVEAVRLWRKAAEQGDAMAQYQLGRRYYFGDAVLIDYAEAVKWNALAAAQGNEDAVNMWTYVLREKTSPEQIAEGQRRAAAFVPHKEIAGQPSSNSSNSTSPANPSITGTGFFITDDGYLISNYHVVKDATKVRLLTGAGLIDAKVVQPENISSTSNCVFDFLPSFGFTQISPVFSGCGASLASTSNVSPGGFPCASATYFLSGFPELNKFASATSAGLFFASKITPLVSKSGRCALLK